MNGKERQTTAEFLPGVQSNGETCPYRFAVGSVYAAGADHNWGYIYQSASSSSIISLSNVPDGGLVFIKGGTLVRTGRSGNILWQRFASDKLYFVKTAVTGDGKIVVAADATGDQSDVALLCFDSKGDLLWQKLYKLPETS